MNPGKRKVAFGIVALSFLFVGLILSSVLPGGGALFAPFATGVAGITATVVLGNVGEHLARK